MCWKAAGTGTVLGTGTATVFDIGQNAVLDVNTTRLSGSGSVNTNAPVGSFSQSIDGGTSLASPGSIIIAKGLTAQGSAVAAAANAVAPGLVPTSGVVNSLTAGTANGNASISATGQSFGMSMNEFQISAGASTAGSLGGILNQTASNINQPPGDNQTLRNVAVAYSGNGNATIGAPGAGVTQTMNSSINSAGAGGAVDLTLTQSTSSVAVQLGNSMSAVGRTASIGPGSQTINNALNTAAFGTYAGTTTVSQSSAGSTQVSNNAATAIATGGVGVVSGVTQSATNTTNVIK